MIEDAQNKMIGGAPAKKEFHFAATAEHYAEMVYAETAEEAEAIYHKVKRLIGQDASAPVEQPAQPEQSAPAPEPEQSTAPADPEPEGVN